MEESGVEGKRERGNETGRERRACTHTHTNTHAHTHTHTNTTQTYTHSLSLSHTHTHTLSLSLSHTHTHTHTHTHSLSQHTHTLSLSHTHTTHTHTHTHTQQKQTLNCLLLAKAATGTATPRCWPDILPTCTNTGSDVRASLNPAHARRPISSTAPPLEPGHDAASWYTRTALWVPRCSGPAELSARPKDQNSRHTALQKETVLSHSSIARPNDEMVHVESDACRL